MVPSFSFVRLKGFWTAWEKLGLGHSEDLALEGMLADDPHAGRVIGGTGGLRKARLAGEGRGKSGGYRVCYVYPERVRVFLLVFVYGKNQKADLSADERNSIRRYLETALPKFELLFAVPKGEGISHEEG